MTVVQIDNVASVVHDFAVDAGERLVWAVQVFRTEYGLFVYHLVIYSTDGDIVEDAPLAIGARRPVNSKSVRGEVHIADML